MSKDVKQAKAMTNNSSSKSMALPEDLQGDWGTEEVDSSDIIIPKLLLMHGQSMLVQDGEASIGDLVKSTSKKIVATRKAGKGVKVIPFMLYKTWVNEAKVEGKWKWKGEEPLTLSNADLPWNGYQDDEGNEARRSSALNFYAMLADDIGEEIALPVRLQFKRTSKKAGAAIAHFFGECRMQKKPGCMKVWTIGSDVVKADETYQIFTSSMGEDSSVEQIAACKQWYLEIQKNRSKFTDHEEERESEIDITKAAPIKRGDAAQASDQF